jgi:hypothetical protein
MAKDYDVIGFAPAEGGYALCYECACDEGFHPDDSDEEEGTPIFAGTEDSYTCDNCNEVFGAYDPEEHEEDEE